MKIPVKSDVVAEAPVDGFLQKTQLFQRWQAMKREILLHKWYESEKAGHDIGWDRAATNWMIHHGTRANRQRPSV